MKTTLLISAMLLSAIICYSQWNYTDLTESKFRIGVTSLGTKAYFAGGESSSGQVSAVEIYDVVNEDWDTLINLVVPRSHIACVSCGTKVFFAGGVDFGTFTFFDIVEIWDTETGHWTYEQLLAPRFGVSAVSYGNKVIFAGGTNFILGQSYDLVEIYSIDTEEWTYANLSMPRSATGIAVGDLAFFAGGSDIQGNITDRVDIYNFTTNTWSIDYLSQARTFLTATAVGTKVLFAGGTTPDNESSSRVDIYDIETGTWDDTASLTQPRAFWEGNSGTRCDQTAYFVGGGIFDLNTNLYGNPFNTIDIYNLADDSWTTDTTYTPVYAHSVIGVEDHLLIAGGMTNLDLGSRVQIYNDTCVSAGIESAVGGQRSAVGSYPNPFSGFTTLEYELEQPANVNLSIYNHLGQRVAVLVDGEQVAGSHQMRWNAEGMPSGIYYYRLTTNDYRLTTCGKLVKY
jgi:hypothetical protein